MCLFQYVSVFFFSLCSKFSHRAKEINHTHTRTHKHNPTQMCTLTCKITEFRWTHSGIFTRARTQAASFLYFREPMQIKASTGSQYQYQSDHVNDWSSKTFNLPRAFDYLIFCRLSDKHYKGKLSITLKLSFHLCLCSNSSAFSSIFKCVERKSLHGFRNTWHCWLFICWQIIKLLLCSHFQGLWFFGSLGF